MLTGVNVKIKTALVSVSNKAGIVELCKKLADDYGVKIISTGGTYNLLKQNGIDATEISSYTNSPEMMDGRVKTLHPKIHGGLLCNMSDAKHTKELAENGFEKIDLVIVNLYPFYETVLKTTDHTQIIENIDIGGPSMIRSGAKNFASTTVITDADDYQEFLNELTNLQGSTSYDFRLKCAKKAFLQTAYYDAVISSHLTKSDDLFGYKNLALPLELKQELRYGENPQQQAAFYQVPLVDALNNFTQLQGKELSYNNIADAMAACEAVSHFTQNTICIVKHTNPCCFASGELGGAELYKKALQNGDAVSAFGGIVAINTIIDAELANELATVFFEVIICRGVEPAALEILAKKKNLRLLTSKTFSQNDASQKSIFAGKTLKVDAGVALIQSNDTYEPEPSNIHIVSGNIDAKMQEQMLFSVKLVKFFKSNAVCITKDASFIAGGFGQTSRIDSVKIACQKALQKAVELGIEAGDLVIASDAFFPFTDNIDVIHSYGIKNIVAPMGSVRDGEVVARAKELGLNLAFVPNRFFRH